MRNGAYSLYSHTLLCAKVMCECRCLCALGRVATTAKLCAIGRVVTIYSTAMRNEANSITVRIGVTPSSTRKIPKLRVHFGKLCATHIKFQSLMRNSDTKFQHTTRNFSTNCHTPMRNMTHSEILQLRATRDSYANSSE